LGGIVVLVLGLMAAGAIYESAAEAIVKMVEKVRHP
jgi:hypothetical protein